MIEEVLKWLIEGAPDSPAGWLAWFGLALVMFGVFQFLKTLFEWIRGWD